MYLDSGKVSNSMQQKKKITKRDTSTHSYWSNQANTSKMFLKCTIVSITALSPANIVQFIHFQPCSSIYCSKLQKQLEKLQPKPLINSQGDCLQHKTREFSIAAVRESVSIFKCALLFWLIHMKASFKVPRITGGGQNTSLKVSNTLQVWDQRQLLSDLWSGLSGLGNILYCIRPCVTPAWLLYTQTERDVTLCAHPQWKWQSITG